MNQPETNSSTPTCNAELIKRLKKELEWLDREKERKIAFVEALHKLILCVQCKTKVMAELERFMLKEIEDK